MLIRLATRRLLTSLRVVEGSIVRLIGAVLLEQNDEWHLQHRYMQLEAMADLTAPVSEPEPRQIAAAV